MKYCKLFIDDIRTPFAACGGEKYTVVRSFDDAVQWMRANGCPNFVSFDHDLGEDSKSGLDVAKWMIYKDLDSGGCWIPRDFGYFVHSANPPGAINIAGILESYLSFRKNNP